MFQVLVLEVKLTEVPSFEPSHLVLGVSVETHDWVFSVLRFPLTILVPLSPAIVTSVALITIGNLFQDLNFWYLKRKELKSAEVNSVLLLSI